MVTCRKTGMSIERDDDSWALSPSMCATIARVATSRLIYFALYLFNVFK